MLIRRHILTEKLVQGDMRLKVEIHRLLALVVVEDGCTARPVITTEPLEQCHDVLRVLVLATSESRLCTEAEGSTVGITEAVPLCQHQAKICRMAALSGLRLEVGIARILSSDLRHGQGRQPTKGLVFVVVVVELQLSGLRLEVGIARILFGFETWTRAPAD